LKYHYYILSIKDYHKKKTANGQSIIVEGPSDQHYLNAIKLYLLRNKNYTPNMELVFMPSGGVRGVAGVVSIVSGKDGKLPLVVLDSDGSGKSAKDKLQSGLYQHNSEAILAIGDFLNFNDAEVEDLVPPQLMFRQIDRIFRDVEDETFEEVYTNGKAIVPQIEAFAGRHNIPLNKGWKVEVAKGVMQQLQRANSSIVPNEYIDKWTNLFNSFNR
jgi:hypothetical protein